MKTLNNRTAYFAITLLIIFLGSGSASRSDARELISEKGFICVPKNISLGGSDLEICLPFEPDNFVSASIIDPVQSASWVQHDPHAELLLYTLPYGDTPAASNLPVASPGVAALYRYVTLNNYRSELITTLIPPQLQAFGKQVAGTSYVLPDKTSVNTDDQQIITEWIFEAGDRVWFVRHFSYGVSEYKTDQLRTISDLVRVTIDSNNLDAPPISSNLPIMLPPHVTPESVNAPNDLPFPSWWSGDCNVNNHPGSYSLGGSYNGVKACGPLNTFVLVNFGVGVSQYEWQCPELSKRYLYLAFGIAPYSADGANVVWNYTGTRLEKVTNGTANKGPTPGDVLSYNGPTSSGHTSVVSSANIDSNGNGSITIIEQNYSSNGTRTHSVSNWYVQSGDTVSGWLHDGQTSSCAPGSNDVALYVDANYTGQCVTKGLGEYPNPSSIGLPNDSISSVKVGSNVKAVLCKDDNYAGGCEEFSGDDGNLGDNSIGNDQVSSLKVQYRTSGGPTGYTWCANEGGYCSFSGTADVAYGANGSFYYKYGIVGGIACNNDVFGDPAYGVSKACYYKNVASTTGSWTADYYDEHTRWWDTNSTANFRCSEAAGSGFLDKNYGAGAPCGMDGDVWVGDYHGTFNFSAGNYVFWIDHDDGLKLWLNGTNIADRGGSGSSYVCPSRYLSGDQNLRAMLREDYGDARIKVSWTTDTSVCNPPPAPSNVQASDGTFTDKIQVTWNTSTGAKLYEVYRATSADGTKSKIGSPTATTYDDTSATAGTTYYYWVKACSDYGCSDYSAYNTGYLASLAPAAPSNLYSINTTLTTITFGWQDNSTNETGFNVYRWRDGDHGWDFYYYDNVGANVTNYTDSDLSCGYANFYLVTAYNAHGESERSGWIMMRTRLCTPLLTSPENGATLPTATEVELDWVAGDYATGYYARLWGGPDIDINSGWISDTLWQIGQLWPGTYNWQVKARDENAQESDLSEIWSFTVAPPCTDDGYEDNDLYDNAVTLGAGYYPGLQICAGDDDWFSLSLAKGQQARIHLDFSHALGDLDAELCVDQSCDPPLAVGYSATDDELLIYRTTVSGVYRLRIFGYEGDANSYNLSLKIENLLFLPELYRP